MDTTISTNILFYSLSALLIFLTVGFVFFMVYTILILSKIHSFFKVIRNEAGKIAQDVEIVRNKIKGGGEAISSFIMHALSFFKSKKKSGGK